MRFIYLFVATFALVVGTLFFGATPAHAAGETVCASGCLYTTITAAVAAAGSGDTITIGPGTYQENSIWITKPLTIIGAGIDSTIVDGQNLTTYARPGVFNVQVPAAGPGTITISGLTIINAGRTSTATANFAISLTSPQPTTTISSVTFDRIKIVGIGARDYGIYATGGQISNIDHTPRQVPPLTVSNSTVSGTNYSGIGVDAWSGDLSIDGNILSESTTSASAILIMNEYTEKRLTAANVISNNTSTGRLVSMRNDVGPTFGGYESFTVTGNTITGLAGSDFGIQVGTNENSNPAIPHADSYIRTATITGNTIRGNGVDFGTNGVLIRGLVQNAFINENDISGVGNGVSVIVDKVANPKAAIAVQVNRNRLFANNNGVRNTTTAPVNANDNWWGCVGGPTSASGYCATVANTGSGTVIAARWISAVATAASPVLNSGSTTTVTAQFGALNTGGVIALPTFFAGLHTTFTVNNGSISPASGTLNASLSGSTTYTAAAVGPDEVRVAIDRADFPLAPAVGPNLHYGSLVVLGEPIPVAITVRAAPDPVGPALAITGGTVSVPWISGGFGAIVFGSLLVMASARRRRRLT